MREIIDEYGDAAIGLIAAIVIIGLLIATLDGGSISSYITAIAERLYG